MVRTIISVDVNLSVRDQPSGPVLHNRWHPDIPPVAHVGQGEIFRVECLDWTGGQIRNDDDATDIKNIDLSVIHILSGPIHVKGARAGDALEVEVLDVQPLTEREWGFSGILDTHNGGGFLADKYPHAHKAIWDFEGIYATSRHIPGVRFAGLIHPGQGARTVPPREHGGNCDIKNLSRGSRLWLPVYVDGANLSMGDIHFSQEDGEVAFCGGIEMAGAITLRVRVICGGVDSLALRNPIFLPGPVQPLYSQYLTFQGISVDEGGRQRHLDASVSFRQAVLNCIEYLTRFGFTAEQAYMLLSCCPCEGRIASIVDTPNTCATLGIPVEIFTDVNIVPGRGLGAGDGVGVWKDRGQCAVVKESN